MINNILRKLQLKHKLIMINLLITGIVFLFAATILFLSEILAVRASLLNDLRTQAGILADSCTASLAFNDYKSARETLAILKSSPNIECAVVYSRDGAVFAVYWRPDITEKVTPPPAPKGGSSFTLKTLSLFHGIELDKRRLGTIYIRSDMNTLQSIMKRHSLTILAIMPLVIVIAFKLIARWQRIVIEPLMHLFQMMKLVSWEKNYSLRAEVYNQDEIGALAQGFNAMLEQIQERDTKLVSEIAERREAEERYRQATEEWARTFDAIADPVMIVDTQYRIVKANTAMAAKLGVSPAQAKGLVCYSSVHGGLESPPLCPHSELLADGKPHSVEIYEERLGGYFIISVSPLFNPEGEIYGSVHYARDITQRKRAEESIRALNEGLELKVEEKTKQLLEAREELVRKEKLAVLGQLSGFVGHELRNPLGVMNNAVYYLMNVAPNTDETVREYLDIIKGEIRNSQRIINDLLEFSRTKTPQAKAVTVRELIDEGLVRCEIPQNVELCIELPDTLPRIKVDPLQMGQVFQNLITNAVQAMPGGGAVRMSARRVQGSMFNFQGSEAQNIEPGTLNIERDTDFIEISVEDTGEGISPENMKKLFQPLFTTKARGIGLGLSVCRNLTEANGGAIGVESEEGKGARFVILLPMEG